MLIPFDYLIEQLFIYERKHPDSKCTAKMIRHWLYAALKEKGILHNELEKCSAKWIYEKGEYEMTKGQDGFMTGVNIKAQGMICSHCNTFFSVALLNALSYDYCPHCGYKMDLEEIKRAIKELGISCAD